LKKIVFLFLIFPLFPICQNLEKINKKGAIKVNGGLNFTTGFNSNYGNQFSRNPFSWNLSGRINVQILDFSLPFTFSYTNLGTSYTQPLNITSISPKYKWFQAHIGFTSINISAHTISGRPFLGAGLELTFKKWKFKTLFGRLTKAVEYESTLENPNQIAYKRLGGAASLEYNHKGQQISVSLFKAKDLSNSITYKPINSEITPKDNFITELNSQFKLFKVLTLKINYAISLLTENTRIENIGYDSNTFDFIIQKNISTSTKHMINSELSVQLKKFSIGLAYKRIDPGFYSLGSFYMNNDFESYAVKTSLKLVKNKINISGSFGYRRNNLKKESKSNTDRFTASINLIGAITKNITLSVNYNNFNTYSITKDQSDPFYNTQFDSHKLFQLNQSANLIFTYKLGKKSRPQIFNFLFNYVQNKQHQGDFDHPGFFGENIKLESTPNNLYSSIISYSFNNTNKQYNLQTSLNYNLNSRDSIQIHFMGPTFIYTQNLLNKTLSLNLGITYNFNKLNISEQHIMNYKLGLKYKPKFWDKKYGKLHFSLSGSYLQRFGGVNGMDQQFSLFFGLGYAI
jgi:hypothetical protein